jgi:hypothetical protein
MLAHIEQRLEQQRGPEQDAQSGLDSPLFTEQEHRELGLLLAQIEPKLKMGKWNIDMSGLSESEHDSLRLWAFLQYALEQENIEDAAKYRRHIACSQEQLIAQFMSIPESSIPESDQPLRVHGQVLDRTLYHAHKARIERAIAANRLGCCELDDMRLWCDNFAAQAV